ncbi:hypothetical protein RMATCC62417_15816 [Rhizopus microsporus]|nr:hypothetical protein RMATCC62417_15816 [Rhizopus microsporus]
MFKELNITKGSYHQKEPHNEEMSIALISIITNIKNMWSDNTIFKKLLDHLLNLLLKLHLAENRAAEYSKYIKNIKEKSKLITEATSSVSNSFSTIDHKRHALRSEYKKLNKLKRKLENLDDEDKRQRYERRITRGHDRITYFNSLPKKTVSVGFPANEASNNDEVSKKYKDGASRSRLSCLKSVAKHLRTVRTEATNYEASKSRKKKYSDKITAQERKFLTKANTGADKKQLLMFIGDCGTGVGSRIKGFRRYGGR